MCDVCVTCARGFVFPQVWSLVQGSCSLRSGAWFRVRVPSGLEPGSGFVFPQVWSLVQGSCSLRSGAWFRVRVLSGLEPGSGFVFSQVWSLVQGSTPSHQFIYDFMFFTILSVRCSMNKHRLQIIRRNTNKMVVTFNLQLLLCLQMIMSHSIQSDEAGDHSVCECVCVWGGGGGGWGCVCVLTKLFMCEADSLHY